MKPETNTNEYEGAVRRTSISEAETLEEIAEFWDTHSLADYWDQTHEVEFTVRATRRPRVTLDPDLFIRIETEARKRALLPEALVNLWLDEIAPVAGRDIFLSLKTCGGVPHRIEWAHSCD